MTGTTTKKEALLPFIESYRSLSELWDLEHPQYNNRVKKAAAYDCLIEKLIVIEPDASRESVVKKLIARYISLQAPHLTPHVSLSFLLRG
jgi:hypothetical protein